MADIRKTAVYLDDFVRADENPLAGPTGVEWGISDTSVWSNPLEIESNEATHDDPATSGDMYWKPGLWDGDDAECWGIARGGGAGGLAWAVDLWDRASCGGSGTVDGYRFRMETAGGSGPAVPRIYKVTNASFTAIATGSDSVGFSTGTYGMLIRRVGSDVEGWTSGRGGVPDLTTWTLRVSVTDTAYTTGLTGGIGINDNSGSQLLSFSSFGAGPAPAWMPEFLRRPWEYQGVPLDV